MGGSRGLLFSLGGRALLWTINCSHANFRGGFLPQGLLSCSCTGPSKCFPLNVCVCMRPCVYIITCPFSYRVCGFTLGGVSSILVFTQRKHHHGHHDVFCFGESSGSPSFS